MAHVEHLTAANYTAFASACGVSVVRFWATWDGSHDAVQLAIRAAVDRVRQPVRLAMFDVDQPESLDFLHRLGVASVPRLFYHSHGHRVAIEGRRECVDIAAALTDTSAGATPG